MRFKTVLLSVTASLIIVGCTNGSMNEKIKSEDDIFQEGQVDTVADVLKIYISQNGKITADSRHTTLRALDSTLGKLKENKGIVYYARANGKAAPPQEAIKVIELVAKYGVSITLFTDSTFTTPVRVQR